MPREFSRNKRLGSQVHRVLSELLRFETKDPRLAGVSLTNVELSRDLGVARVYFSLLDPEAAPSDAQTGLESASGFLRRQLGASLDIRRVPELRFVHDDSIGRSAELGRLIDSANARLDPDKPD